MAKSSRNLTDQIDDLDLGWTTGLDKRYAEPDHTSLILSNVEGGASRHAQKQVYTPLELALQQAQGEDGCKSK